MNRAREIARKISTGESMAAIGREMGISRQRVGQIIHQEENRITNLALLRPLANEYGITILKLIRMKQGITLKDVASETELSVTTLSNLEHGRYCKIKNARKFSEFYELPLNELFSLEAEGR
jgi:transcriptional regulator with XRE-family HTH domain